MDEENKKENEVEVKIEQEKPEKIEKVIEKEKIIKEVPEEYKPISAWGYFGYKILFAIPVIGFFVAFAFACGASKNVNLKSFARSYFISFGLAVIVCLIISFVAMQMIYSSIL